MNKTLTVLARTATLGLAYLVASPGAQAHKYAEHPAHAYRTYKNADFRASRGNYEPPYFSADRATTPTFNKPGSLDFQNGSGG